MPVIRTNLVLELPKSCPKCNGKIEYVNALDSEARLFMLYCKDVKVCKYQAEIHIRVFQNGKGKNKEIKVNCL